MWDRTAISVGESVEKQRVFKPLKIGMQMAQPDYQSIYIQLGRLLEQSPDFQVYQCLRTPDSLRWLGRGHALVNATGLIADTVSFSAEVRRLQSSEWSAAVTNIFAILYRALAHCELQLPAGSGGAFIPVGNSFDAFNALSKLMQAAEREVLVVDPYLDEAVLTDFGLAVPEGILMRLLADEATYKATLLPASTRWVTQYGISRPLEVRLAPAKTLHDRAIFLDRAHAWTLTQSIKDFAKRSPAEILKADGTASLRIDAYEAIWLKSKSLL